MKLKVTQIRSTIGRKEDQKRTIIALGLNKINRSRLHDDNAVIRGMINKVSHLVKVEEVKPAEKIAPKKAKKPAVKKTTIKKETKVTPKKAATSTAKKVAPKTAKKVEKPAPKKAE